MFHLFNKVYIDFDFNLEMPDRIIISSQYGLIPFENVPGQDEYISVNYDAMITDHWGGDEQALWTFLGGIPEFNASNPSSTYVRSCPCARWRR